MTIPKPLFLNWGRLSNLEAAFPSRAPRRSARSRRLASWLASVVMRSSLSGENAGNYMAAKTDRWKSTHLACLPENPFILVSGILACVVVARLRRAEATAAATLSSKLGCYVDANKIYCCGGVGILGVSLANV